MPVARLELPDGRREVVAYTPTPGRLSPAALTPFNAARVDRRAFDALRRSYGVAA